MGFWGFGVLGFWRFSWGFGEKLAVDVLQGLLLHFGRHLVNGNLGPLLLGLGDESVHGFVGIRVGRSLQVERNHRHLVDDRIVNLGECILQQELIEPKAGARHRKITFRCSHGRLIRHDLHRRDGLELELLLIVREILVGKT